MADTKGMSHCSTVEPPPLLPTTGCSTHRVSAKKKEKEKRKKEKNKSTVVTQELVGRSRRKRG
eukprot:2814998-Rhodomonas_salina.3